MDRIDDHVKHYGKGRTRETRCAHCDKLFASRSKDRWRQHMRGCSRLPPEDRQNFSHGRARRSLTPSESASEPMQSPVRQYEPEAEVVTVVTEASSAPVPSSPVVTEAASPVVTAVTSGFTVAESGVTTENFGDTLTEAAAATVLAENVSEITEVLLIHGPCSFVRNMWTGGNMSKADLLSEVHTLAAEAEVSLSAHESNHEGTILDWLLNARQNEIIVLCWVGPLSESPLVKRALELVENHAIVVSPRGVEHGTLPSTVVGVMSGFGLQSIELALMAAKNLSSAQQ